jgi:predicted alternative tryptophan synthase beta-subunit
MACSYFDLDCKVFMVKVSYEQKPFRREVMRTYGADVTPSPSETTAIGRKILADHPGNHPGGQIRLLYGDGSVKTYRLDKPVPRNELPAKVK